jgi:anaerobic ribonucleoside-triphosphate reductase
LYIRTTYDNDFEDLYMYLKSKYGQKLFDLEGIGKQTDMTTFSKDFFGSKTTTADISVDSNSNVDDMSVIAYNVELPKPFFRLNSLYLTWKYMKSLYGLEIANKAIEMQVSGDIYINDFSGINQPYCYNFSSYDVMINGLPFVKKVQSNPPKHLSSFMGQLIHFSVYASNSVLGAVGLADILIVASYYVDKMFKENTNISECYLWKQVKQELQSFIFSCNQPFRGGVQSGFYNISIFDDDFLDKMCEEYIFPDGSKPNKKTIRILQEMYLDLINETLEYTPITFPITTACFSVDENKNIKDKDFLKFIANKNLKYGFINLYFGETSTLSSCCRLRSSTKNEYFNQFGAGGTKIGSLGVVTMNIPRMAVKAKGDQNKFFEILTETTEYAIRINNTKRHLLKKRITSNSLPLYKLGFMSIDTQYSTVGVVGLNEACNFMGLNILEEDGQLFVSKILDTINTLNDKASKKYNSPHNVEQTPSENSAIKMANKDRILGYQNEYELYSNQFIPLTVNADLLDRIKLQGMFDSKMSGGAICHLNIEDKIDNPTLIENLITTSAKAGVVYMAINYNLQKCENGHMTIGKNDMCSICGSKITDNFTRVVGFLVNTKNFHQIRREFDYPNRVFYKGLN